MTETPEPGASQPRSGWTLGDVAELGWFLVWLLALALLLLLGLGLAVHALSKLIGAPLPLGHDDPNRVDWGPLAALVLYGLAVATVLLACYSVIRRFLSEGARAHVGRVVGTLALAALAGCGVWAAVAQRSIQYGAFALGCASLTVHVARGLSFGDDEEDKVSPGTSVAIEPAEPSG